MNPLTYRALHLAGAFFLFLALGGALLRAVTGSEAGKKLVGITHGLALLVILVAGFGSLAKLNQGFDGWVWAKIAIWLALGASPVLVRKAPGQAALWWWVLPLLGALAAYLGIYKPF